MRVRKVVNFYLNEPAHEELLDYLDNIEGDTRRQQALLQMALIGFRVMVRQESGEEAFFRARNPDLSRMIADNRRDVITGGIEKTRRQPRRQIPLIREEPVQLEACELPNDSKKIVDNSTSYTPVVETIESSDQKTKEPQPIQHDYMERPIQRESEEVIDPLALLKSLTD